MGRDPNDNTPEQLTPLVVGNMFVSKYYDVLCKMPEHLYRFYNPESELSFSMGSEDNSERCTVRGTSNIQSLIASRPKLCLGSKLSTIDCQVAHDDAVLIVVTGTMIMPEHDRPKYFTQTFLLCRQPGGYFCRNDVLRFLEPPSAPVAQPAPDSSSSASEANPPQELSSSAQAPPSSEAEKSEEEVKPTATDEAEAPSAAEESPTIESPTAVQGASQTRDPEGDPVQHVEETITVRDSTPQTEVTGAPEPKEEPRPTAEVPKIVSPPASSSQTNHVPQQQPIEETPGQTKSWASLFSKNGKVQPPKLQKEQAIENTGHHPGMSNGISAATSESESGDSQTTSRREIERPMSETIGNTQTVGPSVWVSALPTTMDGPNLEASLKEEFSKYGTVSSLDVRLAKGFAFIDMDSWENVNVAVDAWKNGPPTSGPFSNCKLNVQVRRQPPSRKSGAGGRPPPANPTSRYSSGAPRPNRNGRNPHSLRGGPENGSSVYRPGGAPRPTRPSNAGPPPMGSASGAGGG